MIFVTVGAQMPFNRLVRAVDEWAGRVGRRDVFAQIGPTDWKPRNIEFTAFLPPELFRARVEESNVIVAHAGMGSILTALQFGKPILVMPRRGDLRETRNDHQIATARRLAALRYVAVADDENELSRKLDELSGLTPADRIPPFASETLLSAVRDFIHA